MEEGFKSMIVLGRRERERENVLGSDFYFISPPIFEQALMFFTQYPCKAGSPVQQEFRLTWRSNFSLLLEKDSQH